MGRGMAVLNLWEKENQYSDIIIRRFGKKIKARPRKNCPPLKTYKVACKNLHNLEKNLSKYLNS
jgi:hypothetical protein